MRFVEEFRDSELFRRTAAEIHSLAKPGRRYRFMEVSGAHTGAICGSRLHDLLPDNVELVHGPGCAVSALPMGRIHDALALTQQSSVILAALSDVMRVPGFRGSPLDWKTRGADIREVYSSAEALRLAENNPGRHVIYLAVGFETLAASTAMTMLRARERGVRNFSIFSNHVTVIPAMRAILESPDTRVDAFIGPGNVSTVIGCRPYERTARGERCPIVVSGFEPVDILQSIMMLLRQLRDHKAEVENQYSRLVAWEGSRDALKTMSDVFELRPYFEWRGLGFISLSALSLKPAFAEWDAERRFYVSGVRVADPKAAQCGDVLKGVLKPSQCRLYGKECKPEHPVGAPMVSSEGSCAAYYNYQPRKAFTQIQVAAGA